MLCPQSLGTSHSFRVHTGPVTAVAVSSPGAEWDDHLVATSSVKGTIRLWDVSGAMVASIPCHKYSNQLQGREEGANFSPNIFISERS